MNKVKEEQALALGMTLGILIGVCVEKCIQVGLSKEDALEIITDLASGGYDKMAEAHRLRQVAA